MAFNENYYKEKEREINVKYIKRMEVMIDEFASILNRFFDDKRAWNTELMKISENRASANAENNTEEAIEDNANPSETEGEKESNVSTDDKSESPQADS